MLHTVHIKHYYWSFMKAIFISCDWLWEIPVAMSISTMSSITWGYTLYVRLTCTCSPHSQQAYYFNFSLIKVDWKYILNGHWTEMSLNWQEISWPLLNNQLLYWLIHMNNTIIWKKNKIRYSEPESFWKRFFYVWERKGSISFKTATFLSAVFIRTVLKYKS